MPSDPLSGGPGGPDRPSRPSKPTSEADTGRGDVPQQGVPPQGTSKDSDTWAERPRTPTQRTDRPAEPGARPARPGQRPASQRPAASRGVATVLLALGDSWGSILFLGLATTVLGILVLAWPGAAVGFLAFLLGLQILLYGLFCVAQAIAAEDIDGGRRVLVALLGIIAIVVGVLALRDLTHTVAALAALFGLFWIVVGVVVIVSAFVGRARPGRGLAVLTGFLAVVAGVLVLAFPDLTVKGLVLILGIWLVVLGLLTIGVAWQVRAAGKELLRAVDQRAGTKA
jgi:uncharacterized membrane protein HdeD (DUF308 family)